MTSKHPNWTAHEFLEDTNKYKDQKEVKSVLRSTLENVSGTPQSGRRDTLKQLHSSSLAFENLNGTATRLPDHNKHKGVRFSLSTSKPHETICYLRKNTIGTPKDVIPEVACSVTGFELDKSNDILKDNQSDKFSGNIVDKSVVRGLKERYLQVIEKEENNTSWPKEKLLSSNEKCALNSDSVNNATVRPSPDMKDPGSYHPLKHNNMRDDNKAFHQPGESYGGFKKKYSYPKNTSKSQKALSLKVASLKKDSSLERQSDLQKSHSLTSVSFRRLKSDSSRTSSLNIVRSDRAPSVENPRTATVGSLKRMFGSTDQRPASKDKMNNYPKSTKSGICVRKKPSSTIQRIQEQLFLKMGNDESGCSKDKKKCTQDEHQQEKEIDAPELEKKPRLANTDRLQKQEKPYRQWHRMSRVLTAESKFIISPGLPSNVPTTIKHNKLVSDHVDTPSIAEEKKNTDEKTASPSVDGSLDGNLTSDSSVYKTATEISCGSTEASMSYDKEGEKVTEMPFNHKNEADDEVKESNLPECDIQLPDSGVKFAEGSQTESKLVDDQCKGTEVSMETVSKETSLNDSAVQRTGSSIENVFTECHESQAAVSLPPQKLDSASLRSPYMMQLESFDESEESFVTDGEPSRGVERLIPLNSVSYANEVTGPTFNEHKKDFLVELSSRKLAKAAPRLRTATRNRSRGQSPGQVTSSCAQTDLGTERQQPSTSQRGHTARDVCRNTSGSLRQLSVSHSSERRCPKRLAAKKSEHDAHKSTRNARNMEPNKGSTEDINRNWSSGGAAMETHKDVPLPANKTRKTSFADVASKLLQKVNKAVSWHDSVKKYIDVQAIQDYKGSLPGQLSFKEGQRIKQRILIDEPADGMGYGYYRAGKLRKKRKGLFPAHCVTSYTVDGVEASCNVDAGSSAKCMSQREEKYCHSRSRVD